MFIILLFGLLLSTTTLADISLGLPPLEIPADNPQTPEKIALGKAFFHDSRSGTIGCAGCHQPDREFTDGLELPRA